MKALRFLTILLTTFSLYTVQTMVAQPAYATDSSSSSEESGGFFSGGSGANVGLDGKEKTGDEKAGLNLNMILLLVAVMAAPLLVMYCSERLDTWIYTATSVVYVGMEIANWNSYKEQSDREMKAKRKADPDGNQEQQESLEEAAKQTASAAEAAQRRAKAANVAKMGYMAAGAIALVMSILSSPPVCAWTGQECTFYKCNQTATTGVDRPIEEIYLKEEKVMQMIAGTNYNGLENYLNGSEDDKDFLIRMAEVNRYKSGAVSSMTNDAATVISETFDGYERESNFVTAFKTIGYNIADLIIPKAQATGAVKLAAMGLGAAGAAAIALNNLAFLTPFKTAMNFGFARAAMHLVIAGMAGIVAKDANEAAAKLNGRSAQYRELALKLSVDPNTNINHAVDINTEIDVGKAGLTAIDKGGPQLSGTCFTGSKGRLNEDSDCKCKDAKNCKKSEIPSFARMSQVSIPNAIKTSTSSLGGVGNDLFSGNLGGALSQSNAASSNAARLRKLNVGLKEKANANFAKAGSKLIDFDKMESGFRNKLIKAAVSDIKNLSSAGKSALASRFPGVFGEGSDVEKDPNADIKVGDTNVKTGAAVAAKATSGAKKKDPLAGFAFDIEDSEDVKDTVAVNTVDALGSGDDQVELDKEDIAGDRNKNIFNLITKRYFKTAYPRFFKTKE